MKSKIQLGMNKEQIKLELELYKHLTGIDAYAVTEGQSTVFHYGVDK